ncbi:MAG TPA: galactose oxidase-like domain-containing protein [Actinomycetota bacterium]|nr:galactose oxidase-like domain-containing protein [Actinomycetota bacterium]
MAVLPDGRLLYWNGLEASEHAPVYLMNEQWWAVENSRARILELGSGGPRWSIPTEERGTTDEAQDIFGGATKDIFGADQKLLYDGSVLLAGGIEWRYIDDGYGDQETRVFDPSTDTFRSVEPMQEARLAPTLVTLAGGKVLVAGGVRRATPIPANADPAVSQVRLNELFDPSTATWEDAGVNGWSLPIYPRLHLLPDGTVFFGGAGEFWTPGGVAADQATWSQQRIYDPETRTWRLLGPSRYGARASAASTLLRLEAPYDTADILIAGGTFGPQPGTWVGTTLSEVVRWTPDGLTNEDSTKSPFAGLAGDASQLRNLRWFGVPVMLPTGEVLLMNGGDGDDALYPGSAAGVRAVELYDPETGTWQELAASGRDRINHHVAVLLPDGRVLVGGHAPVPAHNHRHDNPLTRASNYRDSTFEIYEPPYLFRGPRPVVSNVAPMGGGRGLRLTLGQHTGPGEISEVVLVRTPSNTHAVDADMRAVKLVHRTAGSTVIARLPKGGDGRIIPPGPYYVFALRNTPDGPVPSVAETILIQPAGAPGDVVARSL